MSGGGSNTSDAEVSASWQQSHLFRKRNLLFAPQFLRKKARSDSMFRQRDRDGKMHVGV